MCDFYTSGAELLQRDIDRVLVSRDEIARRVEALARQIAERYRGQDGGSELTVLAVLTGSLIFLSDLVRRLPLKMRIEVISASSYPGRSTASQEVVLGMPPGAAMAGKQVLIVDDILDTGRTLAAIVQRASFHDPLSLRTCVLLKKQRRDAPERIEPDFCGFTVGPEFVVGYGLDFGDLYRNLPDICVLKPHVLAKPSGSQKDAGGSEE